jgi:hypothetical protein
VESLLLHVGAAVEPFSGARIKATMGRVEAICTGRINMPTNRTSRVLCTCASSSRALG